MSNPGTRISSCASLLLIALRVGLFLACAHFNLWAQDRLPAQQEPSDSYRGDVVTATNDPASERPSSFPAQRIIALLRAQPELLVEMRPIVVEYLQERNPSLSDPELTDDFLFGRVQQDAHLRALLSRELEDRGYRVSENSEDPAGRTPESELSTPPPTGEARRVQERERHSTSPPAEDQNQPATASKTNPYPNLPSLRDLYRQIPSPGASLKRFGADVFVNGTGNFNNLPMDLPAGPDYVLGPGDGLNINLWGSVSQRFTRTVDREGRISLPEAAAVVVAGQTLAEARSRIQEALRAQFREARVDISLTRLRSVRVYVVGDVQRPGAYDISSLSTPLNALYEAGGPTAQGSLRAVRHYRGNRLIREVDLYELLLEGVHSDMERLEPGDSILVPPVGPQVTVVGMVRRPAVYELKGESGLADVLQLAGGVLVSAALSQINLERIEAHERRVMLKVDLLTSDDQRALNPTLSSFHVQDGDRITISPILPYSERTVYLEGHVFRPGKYPYHEGLQVGELLRSYQDVLPEPSDHAEIVRLAPPDYRPEVIEFRLGDVLGGDDPIELKPFDTIRVLGRYEIDPPRVSIYGEVLRPGKYPLGDRMTAAELVRMAGGFKRSAFTDRADITSYVVQNGKKVITQHRTVEIASALSGNSKADVLLKPGDVVTIRQLAGWNDIGASVTVKGEVLYAGTYGIEEGERLSSLLKRAGGFRSYAYPEGAVLERVRVRELEEKSRTELIQRIESAGASSRLSANLSGPEQTAFLQAATEQRQQIVAALRSQPASGRLVIRISAEIEHWKNTPADVELRAGDVLTIPKRPNYVLISGQVYNASAITHTPGKSAAWYLQQAGGATDLANKKDIFIIRANGSVLGQAGAGSGWWKGHVLGATLRPGDTLVVPEKVISSSSFWKNALTSAQLISAMALAAAAVHSF